MFGRRITLFKLLGFEVRVDASWLILAILIVWTLAFGYFPFAFRGFSAATYWWMAVISAAGLFASIVVHEFSHSLVARHYGLPMKGITLFIFGGVAEMGDEPPNAKTEFLMAIAGPITSIVLGCVFFAAFRVSATSAPRPVAGVLGYLAVINWILAVFNLIPAFPLDGGRVLRSVIWYRNGDIRSATRIAAKVGAGFGIFLMVLGVWRLFVGNFIGAMWWFLIGLFLRGAAQSSYQQMMIRSALEGEPVRRFMHTHPVAIPSNASVQDLVNDYIYRYHDKEFPVVAGEDHLAGCVTTSEVKSVPRDEWNRHSVQEIAQPCTPDNTITPDADAVQALSKMSKTGFSRLMVVDGDHLVAVVALKDLLSFLAAKFDLEGDSFAGHLPAGHLG
jgi:Zn-dependent protease/predicted transcriptional regulator